SEAEHVRCASTDQDLTDRFGGIGFTEKIESLLDLHDQHAGNGFQQRLHHLDFRTARLAKFQIFGFLKVELQLFLKDVRVLISADGNVANEQRHAALGDVDVHQRSTNVQERDSLI